MAVALTTAACSLQDYAYLGAGDQSTDTTSGDNSSSDTGETDAPDADVSSATDDTSVTTDTTDTDLDASAEPDVATSDEDGGDNTDVTNTTDPTVDMSTTDVSTDTTDTTSGTTDTTPEEDAGPQPPLVIEGNLIPNSSFESSLQAWFSFGTASVAGTAERAHTGDRSMVSAGRSVEWEGPALNILTLVEPGGVYQFRAWVQSGSGTNEIKATIKTDCEVPSIDAGNGEAYTALGAVFVSDTQWLQLSAPLAIPDCELLVAQVYLEGPPPDVDFYVDDVSLVAD